MGMPHITSFLCCMGLEMGSKCIGVVQLLLSIGVFIWGILLSKEARELMGTTADMDGLYTSFYKMMVGLIVLSVVHIVLAVTLLVSIKKRSTIGLRVWMFCVGGLFALALLSVLVIVIMRGFNGSGSAIFLDFLEGLVFYGIIAYCLLCVFSYYLRLRSAEDMEGPYPYKTDC